MQTIKIKDNEKKWACINQNNIEDFRGLGYYVNIKPQKSITDFLNEIGFYEDGREGKKIKNVVL